MKAKKYLSALFVMGLLLSLIPLTGCSKDDDEELGDGGGTILTVNGKKYEAQSLPVFDEGYFFFNGLASDRFGHAFVFEEDLTDEDLEKGDDVSPDAVLLPSENATYRYVDGEVIVTKCSSKDVTLKFVDYKVEYAGKYISGGTDQRGDDIIDSKYLTFNGTVTFHLNGARIIQYE